MSLRDSFKSELQDAMRAKQASDVATIRLIMAALKDRDIAARQRGKGEGIDDNEILLMLQSMIKQCNESLKAYSAAGRQDLAEATQAEIAVIERFLPTRMGEAEIKQAIKAAVEEVGAESLRDMGKVIGVLRARYAGQMDFSSVAEILKQMLGS